MRAIAGLVEMVSEECIIPSPLDRRVVPTVTRAAIETSVARVPMDPALVGRRAEALVRDLERNACPP